jgi:hypothetical protein
VFGLPVFIYVLHVAIRFFDWNLFVWSNWKGLLSVAGLASTWEAMKPNAYTWKLSLGWVLFHAVLYMWAPGRVVKVCPSLDRAQLC